MKSDEAAKWEPKLRPFIGRTGIAYCGHLTALIRVEDIEVTDDGWSASLVDIDRPDRPYRIGIFPWSGDFPFLVSEEYWHFPLISERYLFEEEAVERYRAKRQ